MSRNSFNKNSMIQSSKQATSSYSKPLANAGVKVSQADEAGSFTYDN